MFYAGDEYADDDCTSGPAEWVEQFIYVDDDEDEDDDLDDILEDPFELLETQRWFDGVGVV